MSSTREPRSTGKASEGVELRLLGRFQLLAANSVPIVIQTRKSRLLLAYLASPPGQAHAREKLAGLLWPDAQEEQSRASLRHALTELRNALTPLAIEAGRDSVMLAPGRLRIDVDVLTRAAKAKGAADAKDVDGIYRGDFLDGDSLSNPDFEDWLTFERTRCRNLAQAAFEQATAALEGRGRAGEAILLAERLVALDPLREQSHRVLMRVLEAAGERPKALEQYQRLTELLERQLAVEPSPQSAALAAQMRARQSTTAKAPTPLTESPTVQTGPAPSHTASIRSLLDGGERSDPAPHTVPGPISIAVLPLASLSEDSDDQLVARGFSEDLIMQLSRLPELLVIARQSSDQLPSSAASASASAGDLGVRYAVSGTYRRSGDRLRVTVQLTDAATNRCVWAERYDGEVGDAFVIQDEIIFQIAFALDANIRIAERDRVARIDGAAFSAWEMAHRGLWHIHRPKYAELDSAGMWLERSMALSPRFSLPYAGLAYIAHVEVAYGLTGDPAAVVRRGLDHGRKAIELDPRSPLAWSVTGRLLMLTGRLSEAFAYQRRALELNPSFAYGYLGLAQTHMWAGENAEALPLLDLVQRLSPKDPLLGIFLIFKSSCHFHLKDFAAAEATARRSIQIYPQDMWSHLSLAVALAGDGRLQEARAAISAASAMSPGLSLGTIEPFVRHAVPQSREETLAALRAAGVPE
jgi:TolB-like protein/DNA-binding SARP family transcriptional activator